MIILLCIYSSDLSLEIQIIYRHTCPMFNTHKFYSIDSVFFSSSHVFLLIKLGTELECYMLSQVSSNHFKESTCWKHCLLQSRPFSATSFFKSHWIEPKDTNISLVFSLSIVYFQKSFWPIWKRLGLVVHTCNPRDGEVEAGGSLRLTDQPA